MYIHTSSKNRKQGNGSLIVEVRTANLTPVPGVVITIVSLSSNTIVAELQTDVVGQTDTIDLEAPYVDLSETPEYFIPPYASYRITAQKNGYIPVIILGSQIFADTKSIQPIEMLPINPVVDDPFAMPNTRTDVEAIVIGEPTLYGDYPPKIPESEIKNTTAGGFVVLDKVVVPEFIVVHDGSPNSNSAPNYTVRYKDYIKNVASSEIYPTWPYETIKANVIAIISYTLNRVYTEWYRNQGKSYTITSSTAFDHAFFYGRNIFEEISRVVDEVFDIYVKRPGVLQPLFTQYCDGQRSTCPGWMTQWGSQRLGEDGLSAVQILKYFYGSDIQVLSAPVVSGIPESYPGYTLRVGSSGSPVRTIQIQLNRISDNYPLIPKVATDGVYGSGTSDAVKAFQKIFHLSQDGAVGKSTWYEISRVYVAVTKIAALN
ncbi:MAG: peptidoglycan-binding protein [Epulopiscium sp. Nuni2H_MBin001]|nr:MAG: peptidoglycan-binding protein [Epulopiscium sp. Nuni2H_MBin001]